MWDLILLGIIALLVLRIQDLKRRHLRRIADVSNREIIEVVGGANGNKK